MDSMMAMMMGMMSRGQEMKVFDWDKCARLIKEHDPTTASAGLIEDWFWTGGIIYRDGKIVDEDDMYTYLASTWATPTLVMDDEEYPCYVMQSKTEWDEETYWPESSRNILKGV
jgi:hypothetical protein